MSPTGTSRTIRAGLLLLAASGCIHRYDTTDLTPSTEQVQATPGFTYPENTPADRVNLLNANYPKLAARCSKVRAAMQTEADEIAIKNLAIGSAFAGLSGGLAVASGLYTSINGKQADPTISALLAFGAGGTSVPTFFYFGSDEREKVVRGRMATLDTRLSQVIEDWSSFKAVDRQSAAAAQDRAEALENLKKLKTPDATCEHADATRKAQCEAAATRVDEQEKRCRELAVQWRQAADALDDAVVQLAQACR